MLFKKSLKSKNLKVPPHVSRLYLPFSCLIQPNPYPHISPFFRLLTLPTPSGVEVNIAIGTIQRSDQSMFLVFFFVFLTKLILVQMSDSHINCHTASELDIEVGKGWMFC